MIGSHPARTAQASYALEMTDQMEPDVDDDNETSQLLTWEVPEIAAMVVLIALGALAVGGLVAGIIASSGWSGSFPAPRYVTGEAITFGAAWAEPLLAIALLGVMGLSWWQLQAWDDTDGEGSGEDDHKVRGHIRRALRIGLAAGIALVVTVAGSLADLIGTVMAIPGTGALNWSRYVISGASFVGVLVVATGGWIIAGKARSVVPQSMQ